MKHPKTRAERREAKQLTFQRFFAVVRGWGWDCLERAKEYAKLKADNPQHCTCDLCKNRGNSRQAQIERRLRKHRHEDQLG